MAELQPLGAGDTVATDCEIVDGSASVDESAVTGESAPVWRDARPGRQSLLAGTRLLTGSVRVRPVPLRTDRRGGAHAPRWWPAPALAASVALAVATNDWAGAARATALCPLVAPYLLLLARGAAAVQDTHFWRRLRVVPLAPTALRRAARCDTLVLPDGALRADGSLSAAAFWPLAGVTLREVAAAARQSSVAGEHLLERSVVILAKRRAGLRDDVPVRQPLCGPANVVARWVAECGGAWPPEARELERQIRDRGGQCLGVADGGRPLGLVEMEAVGAGVTLDDVVRAGVSLVQLGDAVDVAGAAAEVRRAGRRAGLLLEHEATRAVPEAEFVLAGTARAALRPTAIDLDARPSKLLEVLLAARRTYRRRQAVATACGIVDAARCLAVIGWIAGAPVSGAAHPWIPDAAVAATATAIGATALAFAGVRRSKRSAPRARPGAYG